ncbi:hypothetical protein CLV42_11269 [Chitinophaga ginsengisoli]|uniref:Lipoprotein n=1 Tax=Chitinophaga ginsengisoli TaxID=363837 RepID=A0A2P8FVW9_9BACT|nr:hypothetical protein CLV42_11269 [Chitinophaga ginsengisoli]
MLRSYRNIFLYLLLFVCLAACRSSSKLSDYKGNIYLIRKVKSVNNWYVIYATKKDSVYKIIVQKENTDTLSCREKVNIGKYYKLILHSRKKDPPSLNGIPIRPMNSLDIQCYQYDEVTEFCIEPREGIYDLYSTESIKGNCYLGKIDLNK